MVLPSSQDEALARYSVSKDVPGSVLKCETVLDTLDATPKVPMAQCQPWITIYLWPNHWQREGAIRPYPERRAAFLKLDVTWGSSRDLKKNWVLFTGAEGGSALIGSLQG